MRQPRRRPEHVPRPRGARPSSAAQRACHGAAHARDAAVALRHHDPLGPPARCIALGRPAPVGCGREGRAVELAPRHPRRAHRRARRRPDAPGARPRQAPRRQGLAVVLISHNLHDIFEVATRITVLRLGRDIAVYERDKTTQQEVVQRDHGRRPDEGRGHRETAPEAGIVSTESDIVAPGIGPPAGTRPRRALGSRALARQHQVGQPRRPAGPHRRGGDHRLLRLYGDQLLHRAATSSTSSSRWRA